MMAERRCVGRDDVGGGGMLREGLCGGWCGGRGDVGRGVMCGNAVGGVGGKAG